MGDICVNGPLIYFPTYYLIKGLFSGKGPRGAMAEYLSPKGHTLLLNYWKVWIPVEAVMWVFVPPSLRVAFLSTVSLFWQVVLSTKSYAQPEAGRTFSR